jgi:uncharacterized protein YcbX
VAVIGMVKEIWRFPVKSMQGSTIETCTISGTGIPGDRGWAMRDEERQEIQWGKRHPELMLCSARYRGDPRSGETAQVEVTFPDGETLGSDDPRIHAKLSELVGRKASLWPVQPRENIEFYRRYKPDAAQFAQEIADVFAREPGEPMPDLSQFPPEIMDYVSRPGTFFDNEELNLVTTASIGYLQDKNPGANWDIRRFRPNFHIQTPDGQTGLVENDWVGKTIKIGTAVIRISAETPRCGMTVRPQGEIEFDKSILRTIVRESHQNLGVGAHCIEDGRISVGDALEIVDA